MNKFEALYKENVKRMRYNLETKLRKAALALEEQSQERLTKYARYQKKKKNTEIFEEQHLRNNGEIELKIKHALALKHELDESLSKWGVQFEEVHESNIRRAEKQQEEERSRRRERLREERRSRERQVMERKQRKGGKGTEV